jgi:hypothetical protein
MELNSRKGDLFSDEPGLYSLKGVLNPTTGMKATPMQQISCLGVLCSNESAF